MIGPTPPRMAHRGVVRAQSGGNVALDVLDHHDRVVDHDADRQHQPEQRQSVLIEAQRQQEGEGADDRHRHGQQRDDGRAPVCRNTMTTRPPARMASNSVARPPSIEVCARTASGRRRSVVDARRKVLQPFHRLAHGVDRASALARRLEDTEWRRFHCCSGGLRKGVGAWDSSTRADVAMRISRAVAGSARTMMSPNWARSSSRPCVFTASRNRCHGSWRATVPAATCAFCSRIAPIVGRASRPRAATLSGQPDAHRVVAAAEHDDRTHAGDAQQLVAHVERRVVAQVQRIVALSGD